MRFRTLDEAIDGFRAARFPMLRFSCCLLILSTICSQAAWGQNYTIQTFAGGAPPANGTPALAAALSQPAAITVDANGNLFASLAALNTVVRIDAQTKLLTVVAGNGTQGYNGDNIPATSAELNLLGGLAVDGAGNIYIADQSNYRIRMVSASTGLISTVAGSGNFIDGTTEFNGDNIPAVSANFVPVGVALDSAGNLYIADRGNNRIRKVTAATGIITTVAGVTVSEFPFYNGDNIPATSAMIDGPVAVALNAAGDIYLWDGGTT